jgi:hypothetical protein
MPWVEDHAVGYLARVARDAQRPFRYRSGAAELLGRPGCDGTFAVPPPSFPPFDPEHRQVLRSDLVRAAPVSADLVAPFAIPDEPRVHGGHFAAAPPEPGPSATRDIGRLGGAADPGRRHVQPGEQGVSADPAAGPLMPPAVTILDAIPSQLPVRAPARAQDVRAEVALRTERGEGTERGKSSARGESGVPADAGPARVEAELVDEPPTVRAAAVRDRSGAEPLAVASVSGQAEDAVDRGGRACGEGWADPGLGAGGPARHRQPDTPVPLSATGPGLANRRDRIPDIPATTRSPAQPVDQERSRPVQRVPASWTGHGLPTVQQHDPEPPSGEDIPARAAPGSPPPDGSSAFLAATGPSALQGRPPASVSPRSVAPPEPRASTVSSVASWNDGDPNDPAALRYRPAARGRAVRYHAPEGAVPTISPPLPPARPATPVQPAAAAPPTPMPPPRPRPTEIVRISAERRLPSACFARLHIGRLGLRGLR